MNVGIIGMGRFGKLLYREIGARYKNEITLVVYDKGTLEGIETSPLEQVIQADLLFIAVPISEIESLLKEISGKINPNALVIDVASVKVKPIEWMKKYLPESVEIAGTHPMFGPDSIDGIRGISGLPIAVVPVRLSPRSQSLIMKMVQDLQLEGYVMTADEHDKAQAYSQIYTHLIGRIGDRIGIKLTKRMDTSGFKQLMGVQKYVINDSWELFKDMNEFNPYAQEMRAEFRRVVEDILKELENIS